MNSTNSTNKRKGGAEKNRIKKKIFIVRNRNC